MIDSTGLCSKVLLEYRVLRPAMLTPLRLAVLEFLATQPSSATRRYVVAPDPAPEQNRAVPESEMLQDSALDEIFGRFLDLCARFVESLSGQPPGDAVQSIARVWM
jgi:hypothetical protein